MSDLERYLERIAKFARSSEAQAAYEEVRTLPGDKQEDAFLNSFWHHDDLDQLVVYGTFHVLSAAWHGGKKDGF